MTADFQPPIAYFDQQVLAPYRTEPHKWQIETDYFEGRVSITQEYYGSLTDAEQEQFGIGIQFGYRALKNGELAIVAWLPDLMERSPGHVGRWRGFIINEPDWADDDERFQLWWDRYIEGSWEVENGVRFQLAEEVETIRALTAVVLEIPLFADPLPATLPFPSAQNTHCYEDAHRELYRYLVDGLDKNCLVGIRERIGRPTNIASVQTVAALMKLFPELRGTVFPKSYDVLSRNRRPATHGARETAKPLHAFEQFSEDLELCLNGLRVLRSVLETELAVSGKRALRRVNAMQGLPDIVRRPGPNYSINQASRMVGKTIAKVEFGLRKDIDKVHGSEALLIYFDDGSILGVDTGSNAMNVASRHGGLRPEEFRVDFMLHWVPGLTE